MAIKNLIKSVLYLCLISGLLGLVQKNQDKDVPVVKTTNSPYAELKSIDLTAVTWTNGFWKDRVDQVREITIPNLYEVMNEEDQGKSVHNMKIAAGLKEGNYKGNNWQDAWLYKWIEMAVIAYAATNDQKLDQKMDELIAIIAKAQEPDGYISSNVQVEIKTRFARPQHHEWYNMGHLLTAAALHHRVTGKSTFLDVARKVGDYGYNMFKFQNEKMAHFPINPSIIMGAVELYRETYEPKFLELAEMVIDTRGKYENGTDNWQDRIPLRQEEKVVGHAVWNTYLYAGAADVFMETGDSTLIKALDKLWSDLIQNKMYIHGGVSPLYRGFSFRDGKVWKADEVFESAGLDYQLPNAYGYNETCGQVGNFMWNYRMLNITGEARFAEIMEREMYNGFLGSMGIDGKSFFYVNPLRWHGDEQYLMSNASLQRGVPGSPDIGTCCPTNYSRTLVELQGLIYSKSDDAFWIHHYGANTYEDEQILLEQKTNYPWEGRIEIEISEIPENISLKIRIPEWAGKTTVEYNGNRLKGIVAGDYFEIDEHWSEGDKIIIDLPMNARLVSGNPKIEETRNQIAVMRGPLLYALEAVDLPESVAIDEIVIPQKIQFEPVFKSDLLNGVTILKGTAKHFNQSAWGNRLYQDLEEIKLKDIKINLIPYYAWANRGIAKMTVWLPVDY